jgi:hypothetical protein
VRNLTIRKKKSQSNDSGKFKNKKTEIDGHKFDSKAESRRYLELKTLAQTHKIQDLRLQVPFELIPSQYQDGKCVERSCKFVADFAYQENGILVVEDVKSPATITPAFVIKRKLMLHVHGIRVRECFQKRQKRATSD